MLAEKIMQNADDILMLFEQEIETVVDFPFFQNAQRYIYEAEEEAEEVRQEVIYHFCRVISHLRKSTDLMDKTDADIRRIVARRLRNAASPYITKMLLEKQKYISLDACKYIIQQNDPVKQIQEKEKYRMICQAVIDFLKRCSKVDAMIFLRFLAHDVRWEGVPYTLTIENIAHVCGYSPRTVIRRKKKIINEFREFLAERLREQQYI